MTNEIKEKIEYLKKVVGIYEGARITEIEDYITNLQQRIDKAIDYINDLYVYGLVSIPELLNILRGDE